MVIGDEEYALSELSLEIVGPSLDGTLRFAIASEMERAELELELFEEEEIPNYRFVVCGERRVEVRRGERAEAASATEFFYNNPPMIWFRMGPHWKAISTWN